MSKTFITLRRAVILTVVITGHAGALAWLIAHRARAATPPEKPLLVVAMLTPQRVAGPAAAPVASHGAAPAPRAGPTAPAAPHALQSLRPDAADAAAAAATVASAAARQHAEEAARAEAASTAAAAAAASTAQAGATSAGTGPSGPPAGQPGGEKYALLPSSDLIYDTFYNGAQNQSGTIHWRTDGKTYDLLVSVPLPFVGTYSYASRGHIDAFGLAPDLYTEQKGKRSTSTSRFERGAEPQVVFSRTQKTVPFTDGAQDRFSMLFQLASLVRGDPQRYQPGVTRDFFVIDSDSGEHWPVQTMGDETVLRANGPVQARHFMRLPRYPGDKRRIDFWLAPSFDWLPVRIMQTEPDGAQIELVFDHGTLAASPGSPRASAGPAGDAGTWQKIGGGGAGGLPSPAPRTEQEKP